MRQLVRQYFPWIITTVVALIIFLFSAQPYSANFTATILGESSNILIRQCAHMVEFAVLFLCLGLVIKRVFLNQILVLVVAFILATGFAFLDECHQAFVPGRTSSISDVLLDMRGITFGVLIWVIGSVYISKKRRSK